MHIRRCKTSHFLVYVSKKKNVRAFFREIYFKISYRLCRVISYFFKLSSRFSEYFNLRPLARPGIIFIFTLSTFPSGIKYEPPEHRAACELCALCQGVPHLAPSVVAPFLYRLHRVRGGARTLSVGCRSRCRNRKHSIRFARYNVYNNNNIILYTHQPLPSPDICTRARTHYTRARTVPPPLTWYIPGGNVCKCIRVIWSNDDAAVSLTSYPPTRAQDQSTAVQPLSNAARAPPCSSVRARDPTRPVRSRPPSPPIRHRVYVQ